MCEKLITAIWQSVNIFSSQFSKIEGCRILFIQIIDTIMLFSPVKLILSLEMKKLKIPKKASRRLAELAGSLTSDLDMIDVVVELDHKPIGRLKQVEQNQSRKELIASRKESFARTSTPVEEIINKVGGEVIEKAWINYTLRAKLPVKGLQRISELDVVDTLDSPNELKVD